MRLNRIFPFPHVVFLLAGLSVCAGSAGVSAQPTQPKVNKAVARKAVLARIPGAHILSSELEKEEGKQVWSFDLRDHRKLKEAWVDASTGEVIKVEEETRASEAKEKQMDIAEAMVKHSTHGKITGSSTEASGKDEVYVFQVRKKDHPMTTVRVSARTLTILK